VPDEGLVADQQLKAEALLRGLEVAGFEVFEDQEAIDGLCPFT